MTTAVTIDITVATDGAGGRHGNGACIGGFVEAALSFPTVQFTPMLIVVGY